MDQDQLRRILNELEPGMSISIPKDWFSLNIPGPNETERDVAALEFVLEHNCTWERDPQGRSLTFEKQPPTKD
jgi:hypothetical protein